MKSVKTPEEEYLFTANTNATNLDSKKSDLFHTTIYK